MKPAARRKWKSNDEPSPRERREMMERGEWVERDRVRDDEPRKAPVLFRLMAWASVIVILFAVGYGVTSMLFKWMDRERPRTSPENLVSTPQEVEQMIAEARSRDEVEIEQSSSTYTLSIPDGETFVNRQIRCSAALREDAMQQTLSAYLDAVKENKMLDPIAANLNIFQSGDWLYLNVNNSFISSIKSLDQKGATYLLTGLVKTMSENFVPVTKVKFYVEGREIRDKKPVDLTEPWIIKGS
jgi:hypothetical protein